MSIGVGKGASAWLAAVLLVVGVSTNAPAAPDARSVTPVIYRVRIDTPARQQAHVQVELHAALPLLVAMPVWTPGAYRQRHFARNIEPLASRPTDGLAVVWRRVSGSSWRIEPQHPGPTTSNTSAPTPARIVLRYRVHAASLSDDGSHIDDQHASLCGTSLFLHIPTLRRRAQHLQLSLPARWRAEVPLPRARGAYLARDYDELVDAPIEAAPRLVRARFRHLGALVSIVVHDARISRVPQALLDGVRRIMTVQSRWLRWKRAPYPRYTIVIHTDESDRLMGLEHLLGTSIIVPRGAISPTRVTRDLLYVIAHEHFHVSNAKRVRPAEYLTYDYLDPRPSRVLWWTEGVTDYFAVRSLLEAKLIDRGQYLSLVAHGLRRASRISHAQSLSDESYAAWWPARDPSADSPAYYVRGHVVALGLDLELRAASAGARSLLDVCRTLDSAVRRGVLGIDRARLERELLRQANGSATALIAQLGKWVDQAEAIDLRPTLRRLGLRLDRRRGAPRIDSGLTALRRGSELQVTTVRRGGPAERGGLLVDDRIVEIDGTMIDPTWERRLLRPGPRRVSIRRRGAVHVSTVLPTIHRPPVWVIGPDDAATDAQRRLRDAFLSP